MRWIGLGCRLPKNSATNRQTTRVYDKERAAEESYGCTILRTFYNLNMVSIVLIRFYANEFKILQNLNSFVLCLNLKDM